LIDILYNKRALIIAFLIPVALGLVAASLSKPTYIAQARLLILYGSEYFYRPAMGQTTTITLDRNEITTGELQVLQSTTLAMRTLKEIGLQRVYPGTSTEKPDALAEAALRFVKDLSLSSITQSNILELSFRSYDPAVAADVLRTLIAGYFEERVKIFAHDTPHAGQEDQDALLARVEEAERTLTTFSLMHNIANFDQQMSLLLQSDAGNRAARDTVNEAVSEASASLDALRRQIPKIDAIVPIMADTERSQALQDHITRLTQLQVKRQDNASRYQANSPIIQDIDRQIAAIQAQIDNDPSRQSTVSRVGRNPVLQQIQERLIVLESQEQGLKAKQIQLEIESKVITDRITELNAASQEYRDLLRRRDLLDQSYRTLVHSNEETRMVDAAERNRAANVRVVQPPERPPGGRTISAALALGGIIIGVVAAIATLAVKNVLKQTFVTSRDASVSLQLPVLVAVANSAPNVQGAADSGSWRGRVIRSGAKS
jgi:uncharacterized protein involved in exopolysaccharide biosynthesis